MDPKDLKSLRFVPDVFVDEEGIIRFADVNFRQEGLRGYYDRLCSLPLDRLRNTKLCEVLGLIAKEKLPLRTKFGCTVIELSQVINRWKSINRSANSREFTGVYDPPYVSLAKVFEKGHVEFCGKRLIRICACAEQYELLIGSSCPQCGVMYSEAESLYTGPRGTGTYNLKLMGHSVFDLTCAVWHEHLARATQAKAEQAKSFEESCL